jgi:hypothetical protein
LPTFSMLTFLFSPVDCRLNTPQIPYSAHITGKAEDGSWQKQTSHSFKPIGSPFLFFRHVRNDQLNNPCCGYLKPNVLSIKIFLECLKTILPILSFIDNTKPVWSLKKVKQLVPFVIVHFFILVL